MIEKYSDFLKEEKKYYGIGTHIFNCKCELCGEEFLFGKRDSRIKSIRNWQQILCKSCSRTLAAKKGQQAGVEKLNQVRHEKAIENHKIKSEKEQQDKTFIIKSFDDLLLADKENKQSCTLICEKCGKEVLLPNRRLLKRYINRNKDYNKVLCKGCRITSAKLEANRDTIFNRLLDCTFNEGQTYEGIDSNTLRVNRKKYLFTCNKCGKVFEDSFNFGDETPVACPNCFPLQGKTSVGEKDLLSYIKSIYNGTILENDRTAIKPYELDIYLPEKNLAFEFNGVFWHNNSKKTFDKYNLCKEKGIRLIMLYEYEWYNMKDKLKSYIKSQLGIFNKIIGARKCDIRLVMPSIANRFLEENHLQGSNSYVTNKTTVCMGLYYNDELVQIETFNQPRYTKKYDWELVRECSKLGYNILGGKSKLLKYFQKNYKGTIISYCDKRFFSGKSYELYGFKKLKDSQLNYKYYKNGLVLSREQCMKHKLPKLLNEFDSTKTETENMLNNKFLKLYDFGNFVFEM